MPPDLDDLINSIREEASRESALAIYEGTRQDDLVDEEIDERILNLLGLDDTFDIDYKTYMTLLKERMAAARMTGSQIPTEESELITEEFKRVKRKTGRFKIKTKKIGVDAFQKSAIQPSKLLTGSAFETPIEEPKAPRKKKVDDIVKIRETVVSIKNLLEKRNDQLKDSAETERSRTQKARRAKREDKLEEKKPNLGLKALEKSVAPVKGLFDRIVSGLVTLIAGRFLVKFLEWFSDPDNKEKVDTLIQFLTDFAPAILGGFLLFGTGFGSIIRKLIGVAVNMTAKLLKFAVPKLLKFVAKNPVAAAAIGVVGGAAIGGIMQSQTPSNDPERAAEGKTQLDDTQDFGGTTGAPISGDMLGFDKGGMIPNLSQLTPAGMAQGALSLGSSIKEKGLGNVAMGFAGNALGGIKNFMDEKGISDLLMQHPLAKLGIIKGEELLGGFTNFLNEKGISDTFMNLGKGPAKDITGNSGTDIKGAGVDTQLISANAGDIVINKEAASAVGPNYFDAVSQKSGEKITGAGPDTQMIAVRPGEIVVNKETVDAVGADHFLGLNKLFGGAGANKPKTAKVQAASGGGLILPAFSSGGMVGGYESNHDHSKEGTSASNRDNKKLLKERGKDIKEEKKEEKEINKISSGSLEATLAREDAAVEKALAKEKSTVKTTKKGGVPDMLGIGGLIRGITGMGTKQKEESGGGFVGAVNKVMGAIKNPLSIFGMFGGGGEKKIVDGNIGKPTAQEQKDLDNLAAKKEKLKQSQQKPAVDYDSMDIKTLNSFLDPAKTGASMPHVFNAAKEARAKARAQGLPEEEVQRLGQVAAVKAKMGDSVKSPVKATTVQEKSSADVVEKSPTQKLIEKDIEKYGNTVPKGSFNISPKNTFQLAGSGEVIDLDKPMGSEVKREDFPNTRSGAKAYQAAKKKSMDGAKASVDPKIKRDDFPNTRSGAKAYQNAMKNMKAGAKASIASLPKDYKKTEQEAFAKAEEHQEKKESINARHAQLMKSTDPQRISDYDAEHGEGAYAKKLLSKLKSTYADASAAEVKKAVNYDPKSPIIPSKAKTFEGGEIKEGSGDNIKGETADRQLIKGEPGEYVFPKESVQKLGGPDQLDKVVANTDPNSTPAKMGEKNVKLKPPEAPQKKPMITNLPPTVQSSGGGGASGGMEIAGNNPPSIPMLSNATKARNKMIYGINEGG